VHPPSLTRPARPAQAEGLAVPREEKPAQQTTEGYPMTTFLHRLMAAEPWRWS